MRVGLVVLLARLSAGAVIYADADAAGLNDGTSWTDAYTDLQSALAAAVSGDEIWVAEGTYKPTSGTDTSRAFRLEDFVALFGGFAGTETAREQRSWATHVTVLSGDIGVEDDASDNSGVVVQGADGATLDGFSVIRANGFAGMWSEFLAGLTVSNCVFSDNVAAEDGGGMYNWTVTDLAVTNCTFSGNEAVGSSMWGHGGGMYSEAVSGLVVTNCTFSGNEAGSGSASGFGGGMYNLNLPDLTVAGCTFSDNICLAPVLTPRGGSARRIPRGDGGRC